MARSKGGITKQRITKTQLRQLNLRQSVVLANWSDAHKYGKRETKNGSEVFYDLLTIGQMIEFLEENNKEETFYIEYHQWCWLVEFTSGREFRDKELCNALWEAVKYCLLVI